MQKKSSKQPNKNICANCCSFNWNLVLAAVFFAIAITFIVRGALIQADGALWSAAFQYFVGILAMMVAKWVKHRNCA